MLLTVNSHTAYLYMLARTLPEESIDILNEWEYSQRPLPPNARLISIRSAVFGLLAGRYNSVILHRQFHDYPWIILSLLCLRVPVLVFHGNKLRKGKGTPGYTFLKSCFNTVFIKTLVSIGMLRCVFIQQRVAESYDMDGTVIEPAIIDCCSLTDISFRWMAEPANVPRVAIVANRLDRPHFNKEIIEWLYKYPNSEIVGVNPHLEGSRPSVDYSDLRDRLSVCHIFLNPLMPPESSYNLATLEAVASGLLIISLPHPDAVINSGDTGIVVSDVGDLEDALKRIATEPNLALSMIERCRKLFESRFSSDQFAYLWRSVLYKKPALRLVFGPRAHLDTGIGGYAINLKTLLSEKHAVELTTISFRPRSMARYLYQFFVLPVLCVWWRFRGIEIVLCEEALSFLLLFTGRHGSVVIHHVPGVVERAQNIPGRVKSLVLRVWLRFTPLAKAIICPSHATADKLREIGVKKHVVVIPNLFDFRAFQLAALASPKEAIGLSPYYLMVANDESRKRVSVAIRALSLFAAPIRPVLIKVGAPVEKNERVFLEQLAREMHVKVVFYERVNINVLVTLYKQAEALLCTSRVEGFCRPIIEAQFCGVPVIATELEVLREVAGQNGAYFVSSSLISEEQAFYEAMKLLSTSSGIRERLIFEGHENCKRFDVTRYRIQNWELSPDFQEPF